MRKKKPLTVKRIERLNERGYYHDEHGLYLQVTRTGARSWVLRYERQGTERMLGLGPLHCVDLKEARERARAARRQLLDGIDPIDARRAERDAHRKNEAERITFKDATERYLGVYETEWKNDKHKAQWKSTLEKYAYPALGSRPVKDIDEALVNHTLAPIWKQIPETASRVKQRVTRILKWVGDGMPLPPPSKAKRVQHHPALPFDKIPDFVIDLREREGIAARALEFTILTAARTNEVVGARWEEFDLEGEVWTVPARRMKANKAHRVPLTEPALGVLRALPRETGNPFVFIGTREGSGLSNMAMLTLLKRMDRRDITVHGFRSSFMDWAHERTSYPKHVIDMALAHAIGDKVEKAYRRGELFGKRQRLMEDWAQFVMMPQPEAKVIGIREGRAK